MNESIEYLSICKESAIWISLHNPQVRDLLCASSNNKPDSNVRLFINSSKKMIVLIKRILYSDHLLSKIFVQNKNFTKTYSFSREDKSWTTLVKSLGCGCMHLRTNIMIPHQRNFHFDRVWREGNGRLTGSSSYRLYPAIRSILSEQSIQRIKADLFN